MVHNVDNSFLALIFRMKHIHRWCLMHNTQDENLSQHTTECAFMTHFLAVVGNEYFDKSYNIDKLTVCALFHDISEVLTGDMPTPVKYCCEEIKYTFKELEKRASEKLVTHLPKEMRRVYSDYIDKTALSVDEIKLLKVADKLCAYVKCVVELDMGNREFRHAHLSISNDIKAIGSEEAEYFIEHCLDAFSHSLDELKCSL